MMFFLFANESKSIITPINANSLFSFNKRHLPKRWDARNRMKKSDFPVIAIIYAIGFWFLAMTMDLPEEAQTYPLVLITALLSVNTLYMVRQVISWRKTRVIENDVAKTFSTFIPVQFFGVVAFCVGYLILMDLTGYYLTTFIYLVGSMLFLKVPKLHIAITVAAMALMTFLVFTWFLKVPLPIGTVFGG